MSTTSASPAPPSNANSTSSGPQNVVPSEVGWQFVPQYYTLVNKQPNRLHCFYSKTSTFIHGTEGEDGRPCHGQHEIHQKILSIGFQDCKVFIHSMDAQASANNGIIIQVIGEMSNRGEPWRKFVQTFFLAEQPNGYYVLNDIFRFLKEETIEDDDVGAAEEPQPELSPPPPSHVEPELPVTNTVAPPSATPPTPAPAPPAPAPAPEPEPEPVAIQDPVREPTPEPEPAPSVPAPDEEPPKPQPNGLHHDEPKEPEPVPEPPVPQEPAQEPTPAPVPAPAPVQKSPSPATAAPALQPSPIPAPAQPQPQSAPHPPQPTAPKTWANLAAADSKKWGSAVAQESRGVTVEAAPAQQPPPRSGTSTPVSVSATHGSRPGTGDKNARSTQHQYQQQAANVNSPHVFVKGFVDPITEDELRNFLDQFGKITKIEYVRSSACAFVQYEEVKSAQSAISAGESGIQLTRPETGGKFRIFIETKKERGERPPPRARGGIPQQGNRGGGNFGRRGRGRGSAPGKPEQK